MKNWKSFAVSAALIITPVLAGCSSTPTPTEHYVSPKIQGETARINLEEVQKAFWDTKGKDFNTQMAAFEKRVNEIYDGKEVVSIDASRSTGRLIVIGYINKVDKEGFQPGDEKLFAIEQTGDAVNNELPYRVSTGDGRPYYEGHRSFMDNPFVQMLAASAISSAVTGAIMNHGRGGGWGGHYYTPQPQVVVLQQSRDQFRTSPVYQQQQSSNSGFYSRFKTNQNSGALESRNKFGGQQPFSSTAATTNGSSSKRSWLGGTKSTDTASPSSSPFSSTSSNTSSGWGGRRSSSSSSSFSPSSFSSRRSSFGGRRR